MKQPRFKKVPHSPKRLKQFHWPVCTRCGLLYLRNDNTARAIKRGCEEEI